MDLAELSLHDHYGLRGNSANVLINPGKSGCQPVDTLELYNRTIVLIVVIFAVARTQTFDTDEVLEKAMLLFWEQGYEHTSMNDLFGVMGISRQSLYNTFGNKRSLFEAALDHYRINNIDQVLQPLEHVDSGIQNVIDYMELVANALGGQKQRIGCFYVNSNSELSAFDSFAATRFAEFYQRIKSAFKNSLTNEVARGWVPKQNIETMLPMLVSLAYGMPLMAKAGASKADLLQAAETASQLLI